MEVGRKSDVSQKKARGKPHGLLPDGAVRRHHHSQPKH